MSHEEYWTKVQGKAEEKILGLFACGDPDVRAEYAIGHARGIESKGDLKRALAYVNAHGDCFEKACAMMAAASWMQAHHELGMDVCSAEAAPHKSVSPSAGAAGK